MSENKSSNCWSKLWDSVCECASETGDTVVEATKGSTGWIQKQINDAAKYVAKATEVTEDSNSDTNTKTTKILQDLSSENKTQTKVTNENRSEVLEKILSEAKQRNNR